MPDGSTLIKDWAASMTPLPVGTPAVNALAADVKAASAPVSVATSRSIEVKSGPLVRDWISSCSALK
jgi:hypothetical protein